MWRGVTPADTPNQSESSAVKCASSIVGLSLIYCPCYFIFQKILWIIYKVWNVSILNVLVSERHASLCDHSICKCYSVAHSRTTTAVLLKLRGSFSKSINCVGSQKLLRVNTVSIASVIKNKGYGYKYWSSVFPLSIDSRVCVYYLLFVRHNLSYTVLIAYSSFVWMKQWWSHNRPLAKVRLRLTYIFQQFALIHVRFSTYLLCYISYLTR